MQARRSKRILLWGSAILPLAGLASTVFILAGGLRLGGPVKPPDYWPTDGWRLESPEEEGFDSARLAKGLQGLQEKSIAIDSLLIIRDGYVVMDAYFPPYDGTFPHDLGSATKSIMTTLIAIAADQGRLELDQPMLSFFPDRAIANQDARKERITIRHLAGMVSGMESGCLDRDEPTLDAMRSKPDWVQAALDRKVVYEPGSKFCYDSPSMHILSAILQVRTGMTAAKYATEYLFGPLGIHDMVWESDPQGYTLGWGDLHLKPRDAAKLGYLWLNHGTWEGTQIVPESWIRDSVQAKSKMVGTEFGYGYGWWVSPVDYYAMGRGGQFIRVIPSMNVVIVATGGTYDFGEVESFLIPSLPGLTQKQPANPSGLAELNETLTNLAQAPEPSPSGSLPSAALAVSGKIYACMPNGAVVERIRFEFTEAETATMYLNQYGKDEVWPIGLDGDYRLSPEGQAQRGYWEDAQTFTLELFDIGQLTRRFRFEEDRLEVMIPEIPLTLECRVQVP